MTIPTASNPTDAQRGYDLLREATGDPYSLDDLKRRMSLLNKRDILALLDDYQRLRAQENEKQLVKSGATYWRCGCGELNPQARTECSNCGSDSVTRTDPVFRKKERP